MKVIYETLIGSHLYGTNTPQSDLDICGVFIPSTREILGLGTYPLERNLSKKKSKGPRNGPGDVDHKLFSIKRFLQLACQGQPGPLEMLFSSPVNARTNSTLWMQLLDLRDSAIVSKKGIAPFLGFAQAQAEKMVRRGERYNQIIGMIEVLDKMPRTCLKDTTIERGYVFECANTASRNQLFGFPIERHVNAHGYSLFNYAGSNYDSGISLKAFLKQLKRKEERYGTRSKAAALEHIDYKSLLHCMRLISEAEEFITTGKITLPRPQEELAFLHSIKRREWPVEGQNVFQEVTDRITHIRKNMVPRSKLPDEPNEEAIEDFLINAHMTVISGIDPQPWPREIRNCG